MKCPECGVELMIFSARVDQDGNVEKVLVCRNRRCGRFDERLRGETVQAPPPKS